MSEHSQTTETTAAAPANGNGSNGDNNAKIKNAVELALLAAGQPLDLPALRRVANNAAAANVRAAIEGLRADWRGRALQLAESASGWQFVSRPEFAEVIRRLNPQRPPRLSRSMMEALAIIAYRQPVTRGDIEDIRGIVVSSSQLAFLEEQGWIEEVGRRETPGRPILYATTKEFLDDLKLPSLDSLPPLAELEETDFQESATEGRGDEQGEEEGEEQGEEQEEEEEESKEQNERPNNDR